MVPLLLAAMSGASQWQARITDAGPTGGIKGAGSSGVLVFNISSTDPANVVFRFAKHHGGTPIEVSRSNLQPGARDTLYLPAESALANGSYALQVISNQPVGALVSSDWSSAGGGRVTSNAAEAGTDIVVPLLYRLSGQTSLVAVQNTAADAATTVRLEIFANGQTVPSASLSLPLLPDGAGTIDLATRAEASTLPSTFVGWGRLTSSVPIAVQSFVDTTGTAAYGIAGVPAERAAARLAAPMVFNAFDADGSGTLTSAIGVLNPGPTSVDVRVVYRGADAGGRANACAAQTIEHNGGAPVTLAPGEMETFLQDDVSLPDTGRSGLPTRCAASAVVDATGAVMANVFVTTSGTQVAAAYTSMADVDAGRRVALPLVRREHTPARLTTAIQVQNLGPAPANVTLHVRDNNGVPVTCGSDCTVSVPPGGSRLWWPPDIAAWPANTFGSAWIESDQPVAAVVDDLSLTGTYDQAIYVGLTDRGVRESRFPLVLRGHTLVPLTTTQTPTNTPAPSVPPTPTTPPTAGPSPTPTAVQTGGGMRGAGASGMQVVNLSASGSAPADLEAVFHGYSGRPPSGPSRRLAVPAGMAANWYLPTEATLPIGFYAARAGSSAPIAALGRTDWGAAGGAVFTNAAEPATEVVVPLLMRTTFRNSSIVAIHNADADAATRVTLEVFASGQAEPVATWRDRLHAGWSAVIDLKTDPAMAGLPTSVLLWGRLTADVPVSVTSLVNYEMSARTVYDVEGVPADRAASRLAAPMVFNAFEADGSGTLTSGIAVLNPGTAPVDVRVTYHGAETGGRANACGGQTVNHDGGAPTTLAAGAIATFYQGVGGRSGLPAGCAAAAVIVATGDVLAVVNVANAAQGTGAAYGAVADGDGSRRVALPLVRREHTPMRLNTAIQVQNLGAGPASVTLHLRDNRGDDIACGPDCTATLPPHGSRLWWPTDIAAWPANTYGSAWVESDAPVAVVVDDLSLTGTIDQAMYVGLVDRGADVQVMPLLLNASAGPGARLPTPTDTPPPTATPTPTPTPRPRPAYLPLLRHDSPQG
ncbi:hypothetical protein DCC79_13855 [bacterium]|nr:hypothetical protein [Chloroflexi bacterium CFX6]RIL08424.1 MAG: hypothetical protein DCC79_13855 [bacterium]